MGLPDDAISNGLTRLTNVGSTVLSGLAWLENVDPDQGEPLGVGFATSNDVVLDGQFVQAVAYPSAYPAGLTIGLGSPDPRHAAGAQGFFVTDPFEIINFPQDPDGAIDDIAINMAFNLGSLAPGESVASALVMSFGVSPAAAKAVYTANATGTRTLDTDFYKINAQAGKTIQIETSTPAANSGEFVNILNPMIRLFDAAGNLLASNDNGAADGRNAKLSYKVPSGGGGTFYVQVLASEATAEPTKGEYILSVKGTSPTLPPFQVAATNPADGTRLRGPLANYIVDFNDVVRLTTLSADDLTFNGIPATSVTIVDGNTAVFSVPEGFGDGLVTVAIAAGAISDIQGTPIEAFSAAYYNDVAAPRVVASSIQEGEVVSLTAGELVYTVSFSEAMEPIADVYAAPIYGQFLGGIYYPIGIVWDDAGTTATITYAGLPEDAYTLVLYSGAFRDLAGIALDGEPTAWPIPPNESGDGFEYGDFYMNFVADAGTRALPVPLVPIDPLGSLVYQTPYDLIGVITHAGDTDDFTIEVDAGQTLTILVQPGFSLEATIEVRDPSSTPVGSAAGAFAGSPVIAQTIPAASGGTYTITIGGASSTQGYYFIGLTLNAALEEESRGGAPNNSIAEAQAIDGSFLDLGGGASRGAVLGTSDGMGELQAQAVPFEFIDISATGQAILEGADDAWWWLSPSDLDGFQFTLFGSTSDNLYVFANGYVYLPTGSGNIYAMARDLYVFSPPGAVYWQVLGSGDNQELVIQWDQVGFYYYPGYDPVTFQMVLGEADGSVRFNYLDLQTDVSFANEGLNSYVGVAGYSPDYSTYSSLFLPTYDAPNAFVGTGRSTVIANQPPPADYYAVTLDAGESASFGVKALASTSGLVLQLLDGAGNLLAEGVGTSAFDTAISNFVAPASGTYYVAVSSQSVVDYNLVATRNAVLDTGENSSMSTARPLDPLVGTTVVLGGVLGGTLTIGASDSGWYDWYGYHDPSNTNYFTGYVPGYAELRNFFTFDLGALPAGSEVIDATLEVFHPVYEGFDPYETYTIFDVTTPVDELVAGGFDRTDIFDDLGSGSVYGSRDVYPFESFSLLSFDLNGTAAAAIQAAAGQQFALGGALTTIDYGAGYTQAIFSYSWGGYTRQLVLTYRSSDFYAVTVAPGESLFVWTGTPGGGPGEFVNLLDPLVRVYDADGNLIGEDDNSADGVNALLELSGLSGGTYYIEVASAGFSNGEYTLLVSTESGPGLGALSVAQPDTALTGAASRSTQAQSLGWAAPAIARVPMAAKADAVDEPLIEALTWDLLLPSRRRSLLAR